MTVSTQRDQDQGKRPLWGWVLTCFQPFYWFYFQPAGWKRFVQKIDPDFSPNFCLLQLTVRHWQNDRLRRLLINGFLLYPVMASALVGLLLGSTSSLSGLAFGATLGILVSLVFGLIVSVAAGLATAPVLAGLFTILSGSTQIMTIDLLFGRWLGLILGLCVATAVSAYIEPGETPHNFSRLRQAGSMIVGILVSGSLLALAVGVTALVVTYWQRGLLTSTTTTLIIGIAPMSVFVLAAGFRTRSWRRGTLGGIGIGLLVVLLTISFLGNADFDRDIVGASLRDLTVVLVMTAFLMLFTLPYVLANALGGVWSGRVAGALSSMATHAAFYGVFSWYAVWDNLLLHFLLAGMGLLTHVWRPLLTYLFQLGWSAVLPRLEKRRAAAPGSLLAYQPVFWDAYQYLPLVGLYDHLLLAAEQFPAELDAALTAVNHSRQHKISRLAQFELEARQLESLSSVMDMAAAHQSLSATLPTDPADALLRSFRHVSLDLDAALKQHSDYNQRLALSAAADRLNGLVRELTRSNEPYALRFRPITAQWHQQIDLHLEALSAAAAKRRQIDDPYIIGVPLTAQQELFVGRRDVSLRIEQILLDRQHPPLLLYGQRRMGKTSLLNNLSRLLPQNIVPLFVDLQGPVSFATDHAGLLYNLARSMQRSAYDHRGILLPELARSEVTADPFTAFDVWLDLVEKQIVTQKDRVVLLMLDEFEVLDSALQSGRFSESFVLGMLRHVIQHRHRFKALLAGSHTLDEFKRWSGYLINAETLHLGCLNEAEAEQLVERPIPSFNLHYPSAVTQRIITLTGGHPFLLQLLCSEIIALKNEQPLSQRWVVIEEDVATVVPHALNRGSLFSADIEVNQLSSQALQCLQSLANAGEGAIYANVDFASLLLPVTDWEEVVYELLLRELITAVPGGFRFSIEMVRQWFVTMSRRISR